jgi:hypothetical protein
MNTRKSILLLGPIALCVIVGGSLSLVTNGGGLVGGAAGGLLGGLLYCLIQMAVSRRKEEVLPYDHLDELHPIEHHEISQMLEAKLEQSCPDQQHSVTSAHQARRDESATQYHPERQRRISRAGYEMLRCGSA